MLAKGMEYIDAAPSVDGKVLYITFSAGTGYMDMLRLDKAGATPERVPQMPELNNSTQVASVGDEIYFVPQNQPRRVWFYEFATQTSRQVFEAEKDLSDGILISPDGRYLLYAQVDEIEADVMLVKGLRRIGE